MPFFISTYGIRILGPNPTCTKIGAFFFIFNFWSANQYNLKIAKSVCLGRFT